MDTFNYIVKKFNINLGREYFIDIPQLVGGLDLAKLFAELGFKNGVEIGTDRGQYAEVLCQTIPDLKLYTVDPYLAEVYEDNQQPESKEDQAFFDARYNEASKRLEKFPNCYLMRWTSMEAVKTFDDNSLDFVYIDGNHDFLNVASDIHYWLKKVKVGGILAGHDYVRYPFRKYNHVKRVVQTYAICYRLLPVFAVMYTNKGMRRDRYRSWFIVKK